MDYIDFKDESIPLGKRKVAYIKWLLKKGYSMYESKCRANKKFGFAKKAGVLLLLCDRDNVRNMSYFSYRDYWTGIDLRKYEDRKIIFTEYMEDEDISSIAKSYEDKGWDVYERTFFA